MNIWLQRFLSIVLPTACAACREDLSPGARSAVCARCHAGFRRCPDPPRPEGIRTLDAAGTFEGGLRDVLHAFKYRGRDYLAAALADLCEGRWDERSRDADVLIPVPSPAFRLWSRGYNPAERLARELGARWNRPVRTNWLGRRALSRPQTGLGRSDRLRNAARSYGLLTSSPLPRGQRVLLIDDVCTTGATLGACAALLRRAGARDIRAGVVAWEPPETRRRTSIPSKNAGYSGILDENA